MKSKSMDIGNRVALNPGIDSFHYENTPLFSLKIILKKLQQNGVMGIVRRVDKNTEAIGVQFPNMKDIIWFKPFELESKGYALSFKQVHNKQSN